MRKKTVVLRHKTLGYALSLGPGPLEVGSVVFDLGAEVGRSGVAEFA